jgi:hypothetical protein
VLKVLKGFNPWVVVAFATAIFHIWRGSGVDSVIFVIASSVILSQVLGMTKVGFKYQRKLNPWPLGIVIGFVGLMLFFSPRASITTGAVLVFVFLMMIPFIFYKDLVHQPAASPQTKRARLAWSLWALAFSLIELFAFVASRSNGGDRNYPTISLLLDGPLDEPVFRAAFVIAWLLLGIFLFGVRRR